VDLRDVLVAVRRHWLLVFAAVAVAVGGASALTAFTTPQYATTVTFFVTTPGQGVTDSYQGGLFSQQRVKSYADLLAGDRLARAVGVNVDLAPGEIQRRVSARAVPDTVLLEATVIDSDPRRSERIASELATRFIALVQSLETPPGSDTPVVKVDVVAGPLLNPTPVSPRPVRNLVLGLALGLLVGVGAALLREALDVTVKTAEALGEVTGAPVLAVVPFDPAAKKSPLVMDGDPHSSRAEAFRHLRTNLQFVDVDRPVKVVVVTSSVPEEGKTTTTVNLAIAFARAGRKVLLIEADLRRPKVGDYLGLEAAVGLSNVLAGLARCDDVLQRWGSQHLYVLAGGLIPPNPSELLGSKAMAALLDQQRQRFDIILIDSPPLLPATDAAVVATHADGAVVVTREGKTSQARVAAALASLRAVDARVLGGVLNMAPSRGKSEYYSYAYAPRNPRTTSLPVSVQRINGAAHRASDSSDPSDSDEDVTTIRIPR